MAFLTLEESDKRFRENPEPGLYSYRDFRQRMENVDALDDVMDPRKRAQMLSLEAFGVGPMMFPMIAPEKALSQMRNIATAFEKGMLKRGVPKAIAAEEGIIANLDMQTLHKSLPSTVWDRVKALLPAKNIPGHPEAWGLRSGSGGLMEESKIWVSRESIEPVKTLGHEVAHHIDSLLGEWSLGKQGPLAKLREVWGSMSDDMASMQVFWKNRDPHMAEVIYRNSPNERFAERFAEAIVDEGLDFREAIKVATHETRANLGHMREALHESIDEANKLLSKEAAGKTTETIPKYDYW